LTNPDDSAQARQWLSEHRPPGPLPEAFAAPEIATTIIHVASYLGAAGLGGIVGNRADATLVAGARRLFRSVHDRWRRRASTSDAALSEDEAIDAAKAAAITLEYEPTTLTVISAIQDTDKSWLVNLGARHKPLETNEFLRARVPAGDPSATSILIYRG
jgi:hypothetical protein